MDTAGAGAASELFTEASVLESARREAGLEDFGNLWFLEPLNKLLESIRTEANLNEAGIRNQRGRRQAQRAGIYSPSIEDLHRFVSLIPSTALQQDAWNIAPPASPPSKPA